MYIKAKLRERVAQKLYIGRWVHIYRIPEEEDSIIEVEEQDFNQQILEAFKVANMRYFETPRGPGQSAVSPGQDCSHC